MEKAMLVESKIRRSYVAVLCFIAVAVVAYVWRFYGLLGLNLAHDPGDWGSFGDYLGGLLNPVIAGMAFYWLTQSVRIQQTELSETQAALKASAASQAEAASSQLMQAQLMALTAQLNAASSIVIARNADMEGFRARLFVLVGAHFKGIPVMDIDGSDFSNVTNRVQDLNRELQQAQSDRKMALEHIEQFRAKVDQLVVVPVALAT